jgi:hypothetical protein
MRFGSSHLAALLLVPLLATHLVACSPSTVGSATGIDVSPSDLPTGTNPTPVAISPPSALVQTQKTLAFQATGSHAASVTWSVAEGDAGGAITQGGVYTAPTSPGTYHVVAKSGTDATQSGNATVTVTAQPVTTPTPPATTPPASTGPQFYVATTGNDGSPGTIDQPWRTIQKAMSSATPGSTVNIRAGTYNERLSVNVSGTAGNPITFQPFGFAGSQSCGGYTGVACAGESVVLDFAFLGTVSGSTSALDVVGQQHIVIQGLVLQNYSASGYGPFGIRVGGGSSDIEFNHIVVQNFQNWTGSFATGELQVVRVVDSSTNDVRFRYSEFGNTRSNHSETLTFDTGAYDGLVEGCWFHDTDGIAAHAYQAAHHITMRNNRFDYIGYKRDGTEYYPGVDAGIAIYNDGGHDFLAEGNTISDSSLAFENMSEPWCINKGWDSYNVVFRNNVSIRNRGSEAITVGSWYDSSGATVHDTQIYNNTIYGARNVAFIVLPFGANVVVRNNIVASSGNTNYYNQNGFNVGSTFDYNLYSGNGRGPDAHQVNADPMFANAAGGDFSLLAGSPAIGAGDPSTTTASAGRTDALGDPRFVGTRIDIGAVESP